jgi:predicted nucleic acid-binding protein
MALPAELAILDASVVVDLLLRDTARLPPGFVFAAPAHVDAEVLSALARLCRAGTLSSFAVDDMLEGLTELEVERMPLSGLLATAFGLRDNVALRDGLYVALARGLDATLLTLDRRLASACRQSGLCRVLS